jgi:WD40 repeat protein
MTTEENLSLRQVYDALNEGQADMRDDFMSRISNQSAASSLGENKPTEHSPRIEIALAIVAAIGVILFNLVPPTNNIPAPARDSRVAVAPKLSINDESGHKSSGNEAEQLPRSGQRQSGTQSGAIPALESNASGIEFQTNSGIQVSGPRESKRLTNSDFQQHPLTEPVVAGHESVFVLKGPIAPTKLGTIVTGDELRELTEGHEQQKKPRSQHLHLWNWNKSTLSSVTSVPVIRGKMALNPYGTNLFHSSGVVIDTKTGKSWKSPGFNVEHGERIWKLQFSPSGRYVLAWILSESDNKSSELRIVDVNAEEIIKQFPAGRYAEFNPMETTLVFSRPVPNQPRTDELWRYELQLQQAKEPVRANYQAKWDPEVQRLTTGDKVFEAVGLSFSVDGKYVAASYSYGKVFIWEFLTAKPVLQTRLIRKGKRDKFFAAKLMRFSPDGNLLALASGSRLIILQTADAKQLAEHYDPATPQFAHIRWTADSTQLQLLSYSSIESFRSGGEEPASAWSEKLPRLYEWNWKEGSPQLKTHASPKD